MANDRIIGPFSQGKREGINQYRFAGTGLAGECRKARLERELELMHDRKVANVEMAQH
jgi:hypothetical protein